jgi:pimeloyl-ACP methyl ester carboxylesterase
MARSTLYDEQSGPNSLRMRNLRTYGTAPFALAVIHGGPGAPGQVAPVARELARERGIIEPLQSATSLEDQVDELRAVLEAKADLPVSLVGHSWGAMLGFIFSARHPDFVNKLILVGSAPFEEHYATGIEARRLSRLGEDERSEVRLLLAALGDPTLRNAGTALYRLGQLFTKADAYDPVTLDTELLQVQGEIYQRVWQEAKKLRANGDLLKLGRGVRCPVVAIHGDYDPHPPEGVYEPLSTVLEDFRFALLEHCGHMPWIERRARDEFFRILRDELG